MERDDEEQKRINLEDEIEELQAELDGHQTINKVLQCALHGPVSHPYLSLLLPPHVQALLAELGMVEEEIVWLERKVEELKLKLSHQRKQTKDLQMQQRRIRRGNQTQLLCGPSPSSSSSSSSSILKKDLQIGSRSHTFDEFRKERITTCGRASADSVSQNLLSMSSSTELPEYAEEMHERSRRHSGRILKSYTFDKESSKEKPNFLSEELIKCLIGIFLDINQASQHFSEADGSAVIPKLSLSFMKSKGFLSKTSFSYKAPLLFAFHQNSTNPDPYGILPDSDENIRDIGPYKNLIQITRTSLDIRHFTENAHSPGVGKLRVLMQKLSNVDLTFLTYKQKLAFWINIYNGCIMHAFLEHGLPSTQEKLLTLMNKAAINVGGIVLNALAIEHYILRYPCELPNSPKHQKEMLMRHAYGLGYPEPNVTFALCRGNWSSPALRVYTAEEVMNELERAKVEYLEASVGVTSKRKILMPKLLQRHMRDFADNMESLLEWIYSQLPYSGSLKRLLMECLNAETKTPIAKLVETQPYESEFRYLLPL